jgi:regulator of sigma E protease
MSIIYFILVLFVIVLVHEWGHYKMAKFFNIRVDEFGFGYPPKIKSLFKRGETEFTLNALPFGGFVKIYGEDSSGESDSNEERALFKKPRWAQTLVLSAGVFMNIILALVLFLILFLTNSSVTSPFVDKKYVKESNLIITEIVENSVASKSFLQKGDIIKEAKTSSFLLDTSKPESLYSFLQLSSGEEIEFKINRNGEEKNIKVTPEFKDNSYKLGVGLNVVGKIQIPWYKSIGYSVKTTFNILGEIFTGLFELVKSLFTSEKANVEVSGPIGIVKTIGNASKYGIDYVLYLTAIISLNLAVINILPIPALDGGRIMFLIIEKIKGKPINIKTATIIHSTAFFLLIGLMVLVTFLDLFKLIK